MSTITTGAPRLSPLVVPIGPTSPRALARVPFHEGELLAVAGPVDLEGERPVPLDKLTDQELAELLETARCVEAEAVDAARALETEATRRSAAKGGAK